MRKIFVPLILAIILLGCGWEDVLKTETPTPIPHSSSKQIITASLPLREIWRWSGAIDDGPMVVFSEDKIILASWEYHGHKLLALDAQTGNTIWESEYIRNLSSVQADGNRVYAGAITYVQAYDLHTGRALWKGAEQPTFRRGGLYVYPKGEQLEVYDFVEGRLHILNAQTGESLNVIDKGWQPEFWAHTWPIVIGDSIFSGTDNEIYARNLESKEVNWQTNDKYVSNIAYGDGLIYAIRNDASIVGLDYETGQIVGAIEMKPNQTNQDDQTLGHVTYYNIAASESFVAAYYGNSRELIVFQRENDTGTH